MPAHYSLSDSELRRWPVLAPIESKESSSKPVLPVVLDRAICVVGARVRVHLPLTSRQVSKAQALIVQEESGVYLRDLCSRNRTMVNGRPVCEAWLKTGDALQFGPHIFRCHSGFESHGERSAFQPAELHLCLDGQGSTRVVPVEQRAFVIGSRDGCDLQLLGEGVSLAHAVILVWEGRRYLRDLSSLTGTFVNDQRIRDVELGAGDQIRVGTTQMEFDPADGEETISHDFSRHLPWDDVVGAEFGDDELMVSGASPEGRFS